MRYGQTKDVAELKCFGRAFLQINKCTIVAVSLVVAGTATANTQFCTQDQKQLVNKLLEQNEDPAKSCYRAANGDITTLVTSRLCPLPACVAWLEYMAAKAPDCYYDSTNYATAYTAKSADCAGEASESGGSSASQWSSSSGSEGSANLANSSSSGSLAAMSEDRDLNTTDALSSSTDSSAVGSLPSIGGSTGSSSSVLETDAPSAPTPTPTEDLTIEDSPSAGTTESSNSTTPTPTTSAAPSLAFFHSLVTVFFIIAAAIVTVQ